MGFFSDLKEDLSQAVNELLPEAVEEETASTEAAEVAKEVMEMADAKEETLNLDDVDLSEMLDKLDQMGTDFDLEGVAAASQEENMPEEPMDILKAAEEILAEEAEVASENAESDVIEADEAPEANEAESATTEDELEKMIEETDFDTLLKQVEETTAAEVEKEETEPVEDTIADVKEEPAKEEERRMDAEQREKRVATDEVAVITEGMTIRGDVETEGSLDLIGKVIGNIDILGKLNITGTVEGNSAASEIYAERAHIIGELKSDGALKIGQSSVIIGNVYGSSAVVAGAIKGDIDVKGPVILDSTAIVMGNIKSKSVQINNGAVIEGMCSQCYADVSPTSFFSELKNM